MSIRLMSMVWGIAFPTQSQKLIALKLADYASDLGGSIFPAVNTIAEHVGCDERTVQRVLKAFRAAGILHLVKDGGTGPKATNHWQLDVPALNALSSGRAHLTGGANEIEMDGEAISEGESISLSKGDILSSKGDILSGEEPVRVTNCRLRVTPVSPKGDTGDAKGDTRVTRTVTNLQETSTAPLPPADAEPPASGQSIENGLKGRPPPAVRPSIRIKAGELGWSAWLAEVESRAGAEAREAYEAAGAIRVERRWPTEHVPLPEVAR